MWYVYVTFDYDSLFEFISISQTRREIDTRTTICFVCEDESIARKFYDKYMYKSVVHLFV